ncbi:MAG: mechanosensitive ion channel family protein [Alphaproteobacteria bacterium]|nr:mechanosensitive ion channel family protein [Alphaproteobacteria bacterium]
MDEASTAELTAEAAVEAAVAAASSPSGKDPITRLMELVGLAEHADRIELRALFIFGLALLFAAFIDIMARRVLGAIAARTPFKSDDIAVQYLRRPISQTVVLLGAWWALAPLPLGDGPRFVVRAVLASIGVLVWTFAFMQVGKIILRGLSDQARGLEATGRAENRLVRPRTLPLFEMAVRALILGSSTYGLLLAWHVDVTAWLASAGVLGIAVGFAAQETLSNLLAGVVIIADAPYKLGDYLVLDTGQRGRVTDIGLRSTRMLTFDGVEIIVPNSVMVKATIINESGGKDERERLTINASVAYGTDVEGARRTMLEAARGCEGVIDDEAGVRPEVQFRAMGESSLDFAVLVWIRRPEHRWDVLDRVTTAVYTALTQNGYEIPFPQRDLHIKSGLPPAGGPKGQPRR